MPKPHTAPCGRGALGAEPACEPQRARGAMVCTARGALVCTVRLAAGDNLDRAVGQVDQGALKMLELSLRQDHFHQDIGPIVLFD